MATDDVDGFVLVVCEPASDTLFPVGDTLVECEASDAAGNTAHGEFTVTVATTPSGVLSGVVNVVAGYSHTCALRSTGTVTCWGRNDHGQLGNGSTADSSVPVGVSGITNAVAVTAGDFHSCAVLETGSVSCWGYNNYRQLGNGTTTDSDVPVSVAGITNATDISGGEAWSCALLGTGGIRCWGYNLSGQLGNGNYTSSGAPVAVVGISTAVSIASDNLHSCALLAAGTVSCWGETTFGELGNGRVDDAFNVPVPVTGLTNAVAIAAGHFHSCAVLGTGAVSCWGYNGAGGLGNGTEIHSAVPVTVTGITNATAVAGGHFHSCLVLGTGAVSCVGGNSSGQLGNGSNTRSSTPVPVTGITSATDITAGDTHSCAVLSGGTVSCWGQNTHGQLGNGATTNSNVPVTVVGDTDRDTIPPVLSLPTDIAVEAGGPAGTAVTWAASASDDVDGTVPTSCSSSSGSIFPLGATTITCSAIDAAGNQASGEFVVTVRDTAAPVITAPDEVVLEATEPGGAIAGWTATATDTVDGTVPVTCTPGPGLFPVGATSVQCIAEDSAGNVATAEIGVVVAVAPDGVAPVLTLPSGITQEATGAAGVVVTWTATAVDDVDGAVPVTCTPPPGTFPIGATTVTCSASDAAGNTVSDTFTVTVTDATAPVLTMPSAIAREAAGPAGASANWTATATDVVDGAVAVTCAPATGTTFPVGDTVVTCSAADAAGNTVSGTFAVSVRDTTPPVLILPTNMSVDAAAPSGTSVTWSATATDAVDGPLNVGCSPTPGKFPVGITNINCSATDARGNVATGSFSITVEPFELPEPGRISAGEMHSCAVTDAGTVACWGPKGAMQMGASSESGTPGIVPGVADAVAVSAGQNNSCALLGDGTVRCWGWNSNGALGNGNTTHSTAPVVVTGITDAVAVSVGHGWGCALIADGTIRCWGANSSGQLGNGTTVHSSVPVDVTGITDAVAITAGSSHACAVLSDRTARCWGYGYNGQLGNGSNPTIAITTPEVVTGLSGVVAIDAGRLHTCALLIGGTARCWGNNWGQLGTGTYGHSNLPVQVVGLTDAVAISGGDDHTCAVLVGGTARCWGYNGEAQLGSGAISDSVLSPVPVTGLSGVVTISAGTDHSCAQLTDGTLRCWGGNQFGQLGVGGTADSTTPTHVVGLTGVAAITSGIFHSCALQTVGTIRCWGSNGNGWLGTGSSNSAFSPSDYATPTVSVSGITNAVSVTAGGTHTCARLAGGTVRCWGDGGRLGNGSTSSSNVSVAVTGITNAVSVAAGRSHTCAALADGTVRCWGYNYSGQLGNGTTSTSPSTAPVTVSGITNAVNVTAGEEHSCAVLADGTARCWGGNQAGELGNGVYSSTPSLSPVTVSGLSNVATMTAGFRFTCAALNNGTVRCWGAGSEGRLGTGGTASTNTPVAVTGLTGVVGLDAGDSHACAVLATGGARCWGRGGSGQLGDGTATAEASSPVAVSGLGDAAVIAAGSAHSCAVLASGVARCWGLNSRGQLGDGAAWSTVPVEVLGLP